MQISKWPVLCSVILLALGGCVTNPDSMPLRPFDADVVSGKGAVITSVVAPDVLERIDVPGEHFWGWKDTHPPTVVNGKGTLQFAKTFAGMPIDGNFQVEVAPGLQRISFYHANGNAEAREYLLEFDAAAGHRYYTKFLTPRSESQPGRYQIKPVVYDVTLGRHAEYRFISDDKL